MKIVLLKNVGALAQLVEHLTFNQVVTGSNPVRPTIFLLIPSLLFLSLLFLSDF